MSASPRVLLGVSGSIAAYKAVEVARHLQRGGADVQVAMTAGALEFVRPITFEAITGHPVLDDPWVRRQGEITHVERSHDMDLLVVAPASANTLARLALGLADDPLTAIALSTQAPLLVAPAMEHGMWNHPATQTNLQTLVSRGAYVVGPERGALASGRSGDGRLADPELIAHTALGLFGARDLEGEELLITAGPTWERLDPVRVLANRSTGAMGIALAEAAVARGAEVRLVLGPTHLRPRPLPGLTCVSVESALEMLEACRFELNRRTVIIGAAAVSDFRPAAPRDAKWKRSEVGAAELRLVENPDVLATLARERRAAGGSSLVVGFAAETENLVENARGKLVKKGCDFVVGNVVGVDRGFGTGETQVVVVGKDGAAPQALGPGSKQTVAGLILNVVATERKPDV